MFVFTQGHSKVVFGSGCNQESNFLVTALTLLTVSSGRAILFCSAVSFGLWINRMFCSFGSQDWNELKSTLLTLHSKDKLWTVKIWILNPVFRCTLFSHFSAWSVSSSVPFFFCTAPLCSTVLSWPLVLIVCKCCVLAVQYYQDTWVSIWYRYISNSCFASHFYLIF